MIKKSLRFLAIAFSFILVILESNYQLLKPTLGTDFVSWGLSAMAPIFKIGFPYINYWGINPPGLLMFTEIWGTLFGSSIKSFHLLYIILLLIITHLTWKIINRFFSSIESSVIFLVFAVLFFSSTVQSQFFPSEINGIAFSLVGLFFTLKKKCFKKRYFPG